MVITNTLAYLDNFRSLNGEEAWKSEVTRLALEALRLKSEVHTSYWKDLTKDFDWLDWDALVEVASTKDAPQGADLMFAELLRRQMPAIKSQAQYDAVVSAMDSIRLVLNGILTRDAGLESDGRKALEMAFQVAIKATDATLKLEDFPEATSSKASSVFKEPPAQFVEAGILNGLMGDLEALTSLDDLKVWYANTREMRDKIVTQTFRNELLDAVRQKKNSL